MAMSQKAGEYSGTGINRGRTQLHRPGLPGNRPFYENFRPVSEWKTENEARILVVPLPGFLKEQINISKDDSKRFIRISGERALADNRRMRFNTTYTIAQNCNFNQITTHFNRGILRITIPKLNFTTTPNIPQQDQEATASQEKPTIKLQKSDGESSSFGTEKQEKEVAGKSLSEKGSTATGVDDDRVGKEESLELKKEYGADKKTQDKEMLLAGKLVSEEKNKSDVDGNEKSKEENEVKKQRGKNTENVEIATKDVERSEEKQLAVNICVAVMVIVGLGLELFTTFG